MFEFKKNERFENLGTLKEFCKKFGVCTMSIADITEINIQLLIKSNQEIEFKIFCSTALSEIIRNQNSLPSNINDHCILRINNDDETSYLRVSQIFTINIDSSISSENTKEILKDVTPKNYNPSAISFDDLIEL